jgi:hypothetical protein
MAQKYYRQGDIALIPTNALPRGASEVPRDGGRIVLAYGEVTGHAHAIHEDDAGLFAIGSEESLDRWLRVGPSGAVVVHEEHAAIELPPGEYIVRRQREYEPPALNQRQPALRSRPVRD